MDGTPRREAGPPKSTAEKNAVSAKQRQTKPPVSISKEYNDWHAANKKAEKMPVKFNVYIEGLIKADQDRRLMPTPAAPPPPVVEAQAELLDHLRNKSSQLNCECACLSAACTSPLIMPQQVRCTGVLSSGSQLGWCVGWMGGWASLGWYGKCESDGACERSVVCECPIAVFHTLKSERKVTNEIKVRFIRCFIFFYSKSFLKS